MSGDLDDTDRRILATIEFLAANGVTDALGGGVATETLAKHDPLVQSTLSDRCRDLRDREYLAEVQGLRRSDDGAQAKRARPSYLPTDHPDAPDDPTPDGPPKTLAEARDASAD